jgi:ribosome-binding factor A
MRTEGAHGPAGYRVELVAEEIRNEVNLMLAGELKDPRLAGDVSITEVRLAPGMRTIRIFVRVDGTEEERKKTLKGLEAAKGFVRHELVERLHMRRAPEVLFMLDQTEEIEKRINELLHKPDSSEKP